MAKGSGLSFDPDLITPTVINNKTHSDHFHNPNFKLERSLGNQEQYFSLFRRSRRAVSTEMESHHRRSSSSSPPTTIQFPVNLNCTSHHHLHRHEDDDDDTRQGSIPMIATNSSDHHEMDFFANKKLDEKSSGEATNISDAADADGAKDGPSELGFNVNTGLHLLTANTSSDQSIVDDGISPNSDDKRAKSELAVVQAELERLNAENQRLREVLNQVTSNYNSLQVHMMTVMQQQHQQDHPKTGEKMDVDNKRHHQQNGGLVVPRQFMDLGLAGSSGGGGGAEAEEASLSSSEGRDHSRSPQNNIDGPGHEGGENSPEKGNWGPNKLARLNSNSNNNNSNNSNNNNGSKNVDQATEATMRKARVSVRARSEAPMITDGCQWRKYGQKMAKGNPCPRAYYRCTMAAGCPVRKQVQRCAEDRTILITTYEGNHNHPLPPAAMAMASTTSSAARMLLSGSMPSADGLINSSFLARTLLPCSSSMATISASAPFPTVTLDLTQNPNPLQQFQRPPNQFQIPFPNNASQSFAGALLPQIFGQALYNQSKFSGLQMSQDSDQSGQILSQLPMLHQAQQNNGHNNPLADTVNALTADPNFTAALAAAITSLIGNSSGNAQNNVVPNVNATNSNNNGSVTTSNNNSNGNNKVLNSGFQGN